jgi:CDP-glycerol glycerophosphotransferase (TagB/SpsB family)
VHIPHEIGEMTGYRMFGLDYYDAILLTGEFQEKDLRTLEEKRGTKPKEMCVVGSTTMDALLEKVNGCHVEHQEITILLAPSWGESSILNRYGEKFLQALKETGYKIIVRPHPQSKISDPDMLKNLQTLFPNNDRWEWNFDNDNFDVLSRSDLMISDFSGVMFDFSLSFGKAIIYTDTHLDRAPYDSCWIDEEPWRLQILHTIGRRLNENDIPNIRHVIDETMSDETYSIGRENVKNTAWMYQGKSAQNVVDYLVGKLNKDERIVAQNGITL